MEAPRFRHVGRLFEIDARGVLPAVRDKGGAILGDGGHTIQLFVEPESLQQGVREGQKRLAHVKAREAILLDQEHTPPRLRQASGRTRSGWPSA